MRCHGNMNGTEFFISINPKSTKPKKSLPTSITKSPKKLKNNLTSAAKKTHKAYKKHIKKHFHTIVPIGVLVLVVGVLVSARQFTIEVAAGDTLAVRVFNPDSNISVDEVLSTNIAKIIANDTEMIVAGNVTNLASNVEAKARLNISEQLYVAKPQIVLTHALTKADIAKHVVQKGEDVLTISKKFGVQADTIRWENNLTGDSVAPGTTLTILPVDGLTREVKEGDTAESLAQRYNSNEDRIISFNDAEVNGLKVGEEIIIPDGEKPAPPPVRYFSTFGSTPIFGGNSYVWGNCTWWVFNRRAEIGRPIPSNLGNANRWDTNGAAAGMSVGRTPVVGSIIYHIDDPVSHLGHVGFVERVNSDGSIVVSDMNFNFRLGFVSSRDIPTGEFHKYLFLN